MLAHALERAHVGVDREAVDRLAQPAARLRVGPAREHAALLALQPADLLAEAQQVVLRLVGLGAHALELVLGALELVRAAAASCAISATRAIVAAPHRALHVVVEPRDLAAPLADLGLELVAQVEDAGDGFLQLAYWRARSSIACS